ncbi:MAG: hypothetical protein RL741_1135, partial [Actinomycetota bacterium]
MELNELKSYWNQVLDELEATNRIAWLAFFDARLAKIYGSVLNIDFCYEYKFYEVHYFLKILYELFF